MSSSSVEPKKLPENYQDLNDAELKSLIENIDAVLGNKKGIDKKPETDDELHAWLKEYLELDIPRVAVCPGHDAPFDFVADLFFDRVDSAILVGSRGSGKSFYSALLMFLKCLFTEGIETASVGAVEIQAKRVYQHYKDFIYKLNVEDKLFDKPLQTETRWVNKSKTEILTGSKNSVNGPHPSFTHRDEVELMEKDIYEESLQMTRAKTFNGKKIPGQDVITSTRKRSDGLMQELMNSISEAEKEGRKPPFKLYQFCIFETAENVKNCAVANPDLPDEEKCMCSNVVKGEWAEGQQRNFESVCQGRLAKAQGWAPLTDIHSIFVKSSKAIWEAQQECKRPYIEDISYPSFSRERHGIRNFMPDPENGPIFTGTDFGGENPHAVVWSQLLMYELEVEGFNQSYIRIPEGSLVLFDELYISGIGNVKLADMVVDTEVEWKKIFPNFRVHSRFGDPQAKSARFDWRDHNPPLICTWPCVTRDTEEHFKNLTDRLNDLTIYVDVTRVEMFIEEIETFSTKQNKRRRRDHSLDAVHYTVSNVNALINKNALNKNVGLDPQGRAFSTRYQPSPYDNLPLVKGKDRMGIPKEAEWRKRFGLSLD